MCSPAQQQKDLSLFLGRLEEFARSASERRNRPEKIEETWNEKKKKEKKMTRNIKLLDATNNRQTAKARGIGKSEREVLGHSMCICTLVLGVLGIRNQQLVCSAAGQTSNATSSDPENANCACFQCKFKNNVCLAGMEPEQSGVHLSAIETLPEVLPGSELRACLSGQKLRDCLENVTCRALLVAACQAYSTMGRRERFANDVRQCHGRVSILRR